MMTATYSPDDNKLRLYSTSRLDSETYDRVKAAGFRWAPKQDLFVAPMWTPERAALLEELCGEIEDEDKSLVERAEERAERFEEYGEHRAEDAERAHAAVAAVADGIPMGQPILVGHHSERHARRDAERIRSGMTRAVKMWETSKYWADRARGAIFNAKYKELPAVRHRRIKGIESDKRKAVKQIELSESFLKLWRREGLTREQALRITNYDGSRAPDGGWSMWGYLDKNEDADIAAAAAHAIAAHEQCIARHRKWVEHYDFRLAYERAMLDETGGAPVDKWAHVAVGGRVLVSRFANRDEWLVVMRVNKSNGVLNSVTTNREFCRVIGVEEIREYREPTAEVVDKVKKATKLAPIVNVPGEGFIELTKAEFDRYQKSESACMRRAKATETRGAYRYRESFVRGGSYKMAQVFITDAKRADYPPPDAANAAPIALPREVALRETPTAPRSEPSPTVFDAMKATLKAGVQVVSTDQLFPTPAPLAARVVETAQIKPGHFVLEPSAGTGALVRAIKDAADVELHAFEINAAVAKTSGAKCADFLTLDADKIGQFDRVVMNPPFSNGADVDHVTHAWTFLRPGGRLVAVMSGGVTFREDRKTSGFRAFVARNGGTIEKLPDGSFEESGTSVSTVLVTLDKREAQAATG